MTGPTIIRNDVARLQQAQLLHNILPIARTLDPEEPLPPLFHWLHFPAQSRIEETGPDGHDLRGGFIPDNGLPRRMWAGSRFTFHGKAHDAEAIRKESRVIRVEPKTGRSGRLCFVTVEHLVSNARGLCVREEQDLVYREAVSTAESQSSSAGEEETPAFDFRETLTPDPVMLFRYSALTYNSHRIHYDQPYVTQIEGYPGLIVHGPLIATLLLDLAMRNSPGREVSAFEFRARRPVFDTAPLTIAGASEGDKCALHALDSRGRIVMGARIGFA